MKEQLKNKVLEGYELRIEISVRQIQLEDLYEKQKKVNMAIAEMLDDEADKRLSNQTGG